MFGKLDPLNVTRSAGTLTTVFRNESLADGARPGGPSRGSPLFISTLSPSASRERGLGGPRGTPPEPRPPTSGPCPFPTRTFGGLPARRRDRPRCHRLGSRPGKCLPALGGRSAWALADCPVHGQPPGPPLLQDSDRDRLPTLCWRGCWAFQTLPSHAPSLDTWPAAPGPQLVWMRGLVLAQQRGQTSVGTDVSSSDTPEERGDLPFPEQAGESFPKLNHRKIPAGCEQMARIRSWGRGANRRGDVFKFLLQMNVVSENAELSTGRGLHCRRKKILRYDSSPVKRV